MATKKKTFDAIAESRRWKRASHRRMAKMTFVERQAYLKRVTEEFFAKKSSPQALALLRR